MTTVGSLCTGYGGLELALHAAGVEHELAFVADPDPAATAVLAARHPGVPNLGDITAVDWETVTGVDILLAGYPCQGFSLAGQRKGTDDERFIWPTVANAVRVLRPRLVLLENVAGHRSLGFGRVLGDLATLRYVGSWVSVRASEAGAAHRRERVFIAAWPADADGIGHRDTWAAGGQGLQAAAVGDHPLLPTPDATHGRKTTRNDTLRAQVALLKTPTAQLAINGGSQHPDKRRAGGHGPTLADQIEHLLPTPRATDGVKGGPNQRGSSGDLMLPSAVQLLPTPTVADSRGTRNATSGRSRQGAHHDGWTLGDVAYAERWGQYAAAIARWEHILGRSAPEPTEPGKTGSRLAPRFVEFLMGLPEGWVTDVPGLSRNDQLRLLGNGVVPQQGAHAFRLLSRLGSVVS